MEIVSLRLSGDLLDRVDEHAEAIGGDSKRSFVLRSLIEAGLEKSRLEAQIAELNTTIARLSVAVEKTFLVGYMGARILTDTHNVEKEKRDEIIDESNRLLAKALVDKFGY
jgi:metal-responsive CopG/Arc/MetJ family transcriptional regulator